MVLFLFQESVSGNSFLMCLSVLYLKRYFLPKGSHVQISCLLVVTKESLLNLALTNLIGASGKGLVVVNSIADTFEELINEINTFTVDVILLEKNSSFAGDEALTKLLMMYPKLSLIVLNEEDNWLQIFRREEILLTSAEDFLATIVSV